VYGKIIDGNLVFAGNIIKTDKGFISNPTTKQLVANEYKEIKYTEKPEYDKEEEKLQEVYTDGDKITVSYEKVALTDIEKLEIKKQKVVSLEQQYNMCRYQRELILSENSGASQYAKDKAQEIENIAKDLR